MTIAMTSDLIRISTTSGNRRSAAPIDEWALAMKDH
jgi:hypothetical protein